ncbi:MAG: ABC transporter ATP-binding protein [Planctomycetota bacterium]
MNRFTTLAVARAEPEGKGSWLGIAAAIVGGILVPVLIVVTGLIAYLLDNAGLTESPVRMGSHLSIPIPMALLQQAELPQLTLLVFVALVTSLLFCLCVWLNRRDADVRAGRIAKALHGSVLSQSLKRAELEGAAAQHVRAEQLIGNQLPSLQRGLSLWYRAIPRSVLILCGCVLLALMVNLWLAMLAVVSGVLVWRLHQSLGRAEDGQISLWEVPRSRRRMAELIGQAPILARLQSQGLADRVFGAELESLYRRLEQEDARRARVWPLIFVASSLAIAVLLLGLGVNLLGSDQGLSLPAAFVLGLALTGAVVSAGRLIRLTQQLRQSGRDCESVYLYLHPSDQISPSEQRVGLAGFRDAVSIEDVTLRDSTGEEILSNLTIRLQPGSMVALMGTESVSVRALTELLMGFGRPAQGKVLIDGIPLLDVHPQALSKNVMWIDPEGPIWDGTLLENLQGGDQDLDNLEMVQTLRKLGVYEQVLRLPDGANTIVKAGDHSLTSELTYAIGVARALLHRPPIVLAKEPPPPAEPVSEDPCLAALRELSQAGSLVVLLPRRLQTLRQSDRVLLLNGSRLAGEGRHSDLLSESDLYRHLNYLLFNPYRHRSA